METRGIARTEAEEKIRGLMINLAVYTAACGMAAFLFFRIPAPLTATAVFTAAATLLIYIVSVFISDVSVYDPYWSVAPPVMLLLNMVKYGWWNVNALVLFAVTGIWSFRLTVNWYGTYRGVGHEDWRYAMFREKYPPAVFQFISLTGLHFVPTIVVYAGLVSGLLAMRRTDFVPLSLAGVAVMLLAVLLEHVSDTAIHGFLREHGQEHRTCDVSVWRYSRHPNYFGEMSFWTGMYLYFLACRPDIWYLGLGFLSIIALFLVVSVPMMEKHNLERRADYTAYRARTSMLLLLPPRKNHGK